MWHPLTPGSPILHDLPADGPLVIGFPQSGRGLPPDLAARMTPDALTLPDTCWHVDALWQDAAELGAGWIMPAFSRLVIDLNRQPAPAELPIPNSTPIAAMETFDGKPVYRAGQAATPDEIAERIEHYWRPFHARMSALLDTVRARAGHAVLLDAHSISPTETRFAGRTPPPVSIKTGGGACSTAPVRRAIDALILRHPHLGIEHDGQAKGGFIIHRHARPDDDISAVQIEIRQDLYMEPLRPDLPLRPSGALRAFMHDAAACLLA